MRDRYLMMSLGATSGGGGKLFSPLSPTAVYENLHLRARINVVQPGAGTILGRWVAQHMLGYWLLHLEAWGVPQSVRGCQTCSYPALALQFPSYITNHLNKGKVKMHKRHQCQKYLYYQLGKVILARGIVTS